MKRKSVVESELTARCSFEWGHCR